MSAPPASPSSRRSGPAARADALCVMVKAPRPGEVKTRLAPAVGDEGASALARAFLDDTLALAAGRPWARVAVAVAGDPGPLSLPAGVAVWDQGEGDLGERMERVLRRALRAAPRALLVGTDSPGLPAGLLDEARAALDRTDAVLGPAADGGFFLLGLRRCEPGLLAGLPWSRPETLARTEARLRERGLSVARTAGWFDVDEPRDLARVAELIGSGEIEAPATRRALAALGYAGIARGGLSVVIPTLDEARRIGARLDELAAAEGIGEVIVVDGGSRDGTPELAAARRGVRVLVAPRGRASQQNAGAAAASGEVLLFLHADVSLPPDAARHVARALEDPRVVAGAFRTWTVADDGPSRLGPLLHLADARSRYSGLPYGDQALFVRAEAFRRVGGFPDQPLMEDLELSRRLRRIGRIRVVPASVRVSGRRFLARPVLYTLAVNAFPALYALGVPPRWLARLYGSPR